GRNDFVIETSVDQFEGKAALFHRQLHGLLHGNTKSLESLYISCLPALLLDLVSKCRVEFGIGPGRLNKPRNTATQLPPPVRIRRKPKQSKLKLVEFEKFAEKLDGGIVVL